MKRFLAGLTLLSMTAACTPTVSYRGYVPEAAALATLRPGLDNKEAVRTKLGTPTVTGTLDDSVWYYVGRREEQLGPTPPKVTEAEALALHFNAAGILQSTQRYTAEDGVELKPVDRITPVPGRDLNAVQQVLSNLGRFNGAGMQKKTGGIPGAGIPGSP